MIHIREWITKLVVVIDGYLKGMIGKVWQVETVIGEETRCKIIFGGAGCEAWVNEFQIRPLECVEQLIEDGIEIYSNSNGAFKNAYEIINELKEKKSMTNINWDAYASLSKCFGNQYTDGNGMMPYKELDRRIKDVNILVENKVVEVTFADGTKEKAVCQEPDVFSLETAIAICLSKKIMGGSSAYNNAVKRGVKVYEDKLKEAELAKAEHERIEKKRAKRLAYKERKLAKRKAQEREEKIEIQKEAYIRAMTYMNDVSKNVAAN